jgi:hypothetical protein
VFDDLKASIRDLVSARLHPDDRRAAVASMKDALVRAKMGIADIRDGLAATRQRLATEEAELATVERRRVMAEQIADADTVAIAERVARQLRERVEVLRRKADVEADELALAEREVQEMTQQLKVAASGGGAAPPMTATIADELEPDVALKRDFDALSRQNARVAAEQDADARLAELKRRMGH